MNRLREAKALVPPTQKAATCRVAVIRRQLNEEELAEFENDLADPDVKAKYLALVMRQAGFVIRDQSITRHRRREEGTGCQCPLD